MQLQFMPISVPFVEYSNAGLSAGGSVLDNIVRSLRKHSDFRYPQTLMLLNSGNTVKNTDEKIQYFKMLQFVFQNNSKVCPTGMRIVEWNAATMLDNTSNTTIDHTRLVRVLIAHNQALLKVHFGNELTVDFSIVFRYFLRRITSSSKRQLR